MSQFSSRRALNRSFSSKINARRTLFHGFPANVRSGTPRGGCVVGRCWEACSSWVPVPLFGLSSWLGRWTQKLIHYFLYIKLSKTDKTGLGTIGQGRAGRAGEAGSEMWSVLLVPSSSPTLWLINDGLDVNVVSNVTWFHLNHDMVSRGIYKLSSYGGHSIFQRVTKSQYPIRSIWGIGDTSLLEPNRPLACLWTNCSINRTFGSSGPLRGDSVWWDDMCVRSCRIPGTKVYGDENVSSFFFNNNIRIERYLFFFFPFHLLSSHCSRAPSQ